MCHTYLLIYSFHKLTNLDANNSSFAVWFNLHCSLCITYDAPTWTHLLTHVRYMDMQFFLKNYWDDISSICWLKSLNFFINIVPFWQPKKKKNFNLFSTTYFHKKYSACKSRTFCYFLSTHSLENHYSKIILMVVKQGNSISSILYLL